MSMAMRLLGPKADDHGLEEEDAGHTYIFNILIPSGEKAGLEIMISYYCACELECKCVFESYRSIDNGRSDRFNYIHDGPES